MFDDVLGAAHHGSGDAGGLERPRHQRQALVADGAVGDQQRGVCIVFATAGDDLGRVDLDRPALAAVGRRAVKARCQRADASHGRRPAQRGEREVAADVVGPRVPAVDRDMGDAQVVVLRGVARVDGVELGAGVVRRAGALVAAVGSIRRGGGDEGDAAFGQRPGQGLERHFGVMRPGIGRAIAQRLVPVARAAHIGDRHIVLGGEVRHLIAGFAHDGCLRIGGAAARAAARTAARVAALVAAHAAASAAARVDASACARVDARVVAVSDAGVVVRVSAGNPGRPPFM